MNSLLVLKTISDPSKSKLMALYSVVRKTKIVARLKLKNTKRNTLGFIVILLCAIQTKNNIGINRFIKVGVLHELTRRTDKNIQKT
jgi:hypothetical protein